MSNSETPRTVGCQSPVRGILKQNAQECIFPFPFPSPGSSGPESNLGLHVWQAVSLPSEPPGSQFLIRQRMMPRGSHMSGKTSAPLHTGQWVAGVHWGPCRWHFPSRALIHLRVSALFCCARVPHMWLPRRVPTPSQTVTAPAQEAARPKPLPGFPASTTPSLSGLLPAPLLLFLFPVGRGLPPLSSDHHDALPQPLCSCSAPEPPFSPPLALMHPSRLSSMPPPGRASLSPAPFQLLWHISADQQPLGLAVPFHLYTQPCALGVRISLLLFLLGHRV